MPIIPNLPLTDEQQELVDFCIEFKTAKGFMAVYHHMLKEHGKPGVAYEATEQLHVILFRNRRYLDREVFFGARAHHKKRNKK